MGYFGLLNTTTSINFPRVRHVMGVVGKIAARDCAASAPCGSDSLWIVGNGKNSFRLTSSEREFVSQRCHHSKDGDNMSLPKTASELREITNDFNTPTAKYKQRKRDKI